MDRRKHLVQMLKMLTEVKAYYPLIIVYSVLTSVFYLATPISVQSLVSTFSLGPYFKPILFLTIILLFLLTMLAIVKSLQYLMIEYLQRNFFAKNAIKIAKAYANENDSAQSMLQNKANRFFEIINIYKNIAFLSTELLNFFLQVTIGLFLICLYHPYFILFSIVIILSLYAPIYFLGGIGLSSAIKKSKAKYDVANYLEELSYKRDQFTVDQINNDISERIDSFLKSKASHFKILFTQNIIYLTLFAFLNALLLGLGGFLVISNQLTVGQLIAAEIVVNGILGHLLYVKKYLENFYDMYAGVEKLSVFNMVIDSMESSQDKSFDKNLNHRKFRMWIYEPSNYKRVFKKFFLTLSVLLLIFLILPWQQFSRGTGKVIAYNPNDRVQQVTATITGVIDEWLVVDGQFVKAGDPIVRLMDNDPNYMQRLESKRDAAVARLEAAKQASLTAKINFDRQEKLAQEGLSSQKDYEQAKINYKKLKADEASAVATLAEAEVDLSRQQVQVVTAPRDGQILRILKGSGKTLAKSGDPLVDFVPNSDVKAAEMYLDGNDLPLVQIGKKVRLQFEGWPAVQFSGWPSVAVGSFGGVVKSIDPYVSSTGTFRVIVSPDPDDKESWPSDSILRQGTRVVGIVILEQVSVMYELWRQINGFPKSTSEPPPASLSSGDAK